MNEGPTGGRSHDIDDLHFDQIAATKLVVDCQVEQREIAMVLGKFESNPDRPDMFRFQRTFLADNTAFVPGRTSARMAGKFGVSMIDPPIRHALPQRQPDVDNAPYHGMLRRIRSRKEPIVILYGKRAGEVLRFGISVRSLSL